jgi:hypothetical protein
MTNLLYLSIANCKQSLKVPKGLSENVNTMANRKKEIWQNIFTINIFVIHFITRYKTHSELVASKKKKPGDFTSE